MCKYLKTPKGPQFLLFELQGFVSGFSLTSKNYFIILKKKKKSIKQFQIIAAGGPVFWDLKKNDPHGEKRHKLSQSGSLGNPDTFSKANIV